MPALPPRVTIRDLARVTGFSASTVSLALRHSRLLADETRQLIIAAADRLGYVRDPKVAAMMNYLAQRQRGNARGDTLAYVFPVAADAPYARIPFYRRCFEGARDRAASLGYRLETFHLGPDLTPRRLDQILHARGIRGILFSQHPIPHSHIEMEWSRYAGVILGYGLEKPALHRVCPDVYEATRVCYHHLTEFGYRKIGLLIDDRKNEITRHLLRAAYLDLCFASNQTPSILQVPSILDRGPALRSWIAEHGIDGVVSLSRDLIAALRQLSIGVPEECGVALVNVLSMFEFSGYKTRAYAIGETAVNQLVSDVEHDLLGLPQNPLTITIQGEWQSGQTTMPQAERRAAARGAL